MITLPYGRQLGEIVEQPPGPNSRRLAAQLRRYESRNITYISDDFPIFWSRGLGANITDVDQNVYVDLTAAFGVAAVGHSNERVAAAVSRQAHRLLHGMGDVYPTGNKVALAKMLCEITPGGEPKKVIFASTGSEAIEAALKTAAVASGKPGVICFTGAYHGLTYGALSVTDRSHFKEPFLQQLGDFAVRAPYPYCYRCPPELAHPTCSEGCFNALREIVLSERGASVGAVILEVVQGRGGDIPAPVDWLRNVRRLCDERQLILIVDEIYTGFGRTGHWFACERAGLIPDIICVGKGLSSGFPIAACVGSAAVMDRWPETTGEAIHTSTFLGNPTGCEAALASIAELRDADLVQRVSALEPTIAEALEDLKAASKERIGDVRGCGLMWGVELVDRSGAPDGAAAQVVVIEAMRRGVLVLTSGPGGNVIAISPPLVITAEQLAFALGILRDAVAEFSIK